MATIMEFYKLDVSAFEIHGIIVKSLPENRQFDTIKLYTVADELIYLRPKGLTIPDNHRLLLRGPKIAICGFDQTSIIIGDQTWGWHTSFDNWSYPHDGIKHLEVRDPEFPEACVEIIIEKFSKPAQAHFKFILEDKLKDREIRIVRGEISAISNYNKDTKRLLRCFGADLTKNLRPSEDPEENSKRKKRLPFPLVPGKAIDLYRKHLILGAKSVLIIEFNLELEVVNGGITQSPLSLQETASFRAPDDPDFVENKDFLPQAMVSRKKTDSLEIDEFASIRVEVSWFNDLSPSVPGNSGFTLWGYRDGDCDYDEFDWEDRQEFKWKEEIMP